jgi:putative tryptophan/tyrosine transport system substrate-binding protein
MERRQFLLTSLAAALAAPIAAGAQQAGKAYRLGWLWGVRPTDELLKAMRDGLHEHGWVEGRNFVFEHRAAEGHPDRQAELIADLLRLEVGVLVTSQTVAVKAAMAATRTLPIVMLGTGDPVRYGLVHSLARPGGQVTGLALLVNDVSVKLLGLLREAATAISHVGIFVNPVNPGAASYLAEVQAAARTLGLRSHIAEIRRPDDLEGTFASLLRERVDALLLGPEATMLTLRSRIAEFGLRHRLPVVGALRPFAEAGALLSYAPDQVFLHRQAASYVDKILKGAKPADLPVQQPSKFLFVINLKTARTVGLTIPPSLLARADQVID